MKPILLRGSRNTKSLLILLMTVCLFGIPLAATACYRSPVAGVLTFLILAATIAFGSFLSFLIRMPPISEEGIGSGKTFLRWEDARITVDWQLMKGYSVIAFVGDRFLTHTDLQSRGAWRQKIRFAIALTPKNIEQLLRYYPDIVYFARPFPEVKFLKQLESLLRAHNRSVKREDPDQTDKS